MRAEGYRLDTMALADVGEVANLEGRIFPSPWTAAAFLHELRSNPYARNWVVRGEGGALAGYTCVWILGEDLLINNIAVAPDHRRRGVGRTLLGRALDAGRDAGCRRAILEVRPSNAPALSLYRAHGFERIGLRRRYYSDGEDALVLSRPFMAEDGPVAP